MHWRAAVNRRFEGGSERGDLLTGAGGRALTSSLEVEFSFVSLSIKKLICMMSITDLTCLCKNAGMGSEGAGSRGQKLSG